MKKATTAARSLFILVIWGLICCFNILQPAYAAQRSDVVISVTTAKTQIINENVILAKKQAVEAALDIAVKNAYASLVSQQVFAAHLDFLYETILSNTREYIVTYRELGGIESRGFYLAGVESKIDLKALEKTMIEARIIDPDKSKPAILFFIAEKTPADPMPRHWWGKSNTEYYSIAEKIIADQLLQERFVIIGNGTERPDPSFYNIRFSSLYDVESAIHLGREVKADMVVFGTVVSSEAINRIGQEKTFTAQVNLEAYNVETGEKVLITQVQAVAKSEDNSEGNLKATMKGAKLASQDLSVKIDDYWQKLLTTEHSFDVRFEGDNFLARFIALTNRIRQMPGLENMQPKEEDANSAVVEVFYKGSPSQFANDVAIKTFESFGLEIVEITENQVTIRFVEKGQAIQDQPRTETGQPAQPGMIDQPDQPETQIIRSEPLERDTLVPE